MRKIVQIITFTDGRGKNRILALHEDGSVYEVKPNDNGGIYYINEPASTEEDKNELVEFVKDPFNWILPLSILFFVFCLLGVV